MAGAKVAGSEGVKKSDTADVKPIPRGRAMVIEKIERVSAAAAEARTEVKGCSQLTDSERSAFDQKLGVMASECKKMDGMIREGSATA